MKLHQTTEHTVSAVLGDGATLPLMRSWRAAAVDLLLSGTISELPARC